MYSIYKVKIFLCEKLELRQLLVIFLTFWAGSVEQQSGCTDTVRKNWECSCGILFPLNTSGGTEWDSWGAVINTENLFIVQRWENITSAKPLNAWLFWFLSVLAVTVPFEIRIFFWGKGFSMVLCVTSVTVADVWTGGEIEEKFFETVVGLEIGH